MIAAIPPWILDEAWRPLNPPSEVLLLGEMPRAPEKLLAATRVLHVTLARRYQPDASGTKCNINKSDVMQIMNAPLPHVFDLGDARGLRELTANDTYDGLQAMRFPGWTMLGTMASADAVAAWVGSGRPAVAVWKNPTPRTDSRGRVLTVNGRVVYKSGHINPVVPTPAGKGGVYVTGAGAHCVEECPIQFSFGQYTSQVLFFGHE